MIEARIKEIVGKVLGESLVNYKLQDIKISNFDSWDSLAHLKLIIALEDEFDIEIEPEEIVLMKDGGEKIKEIIESK